MEEEDPDCRNDPLYSIDIRQYLVTFLRYLARRGLFSPIPPREFCQQPYFSHFAPHLNPQEVTKN